MQTRNMRTVVLSVAGSCALALLLMLTPLKTSNAQQSASGLADKTVVFVIPYSAGAYPDVLARIYAQKLSEATKGTFIVENKPGAGGLLAIQSMLRAPPDTHVFLVTDEQQRAINPYANKSLSYDPRRDFTPVATFAVGPMFLIGGPSLPARNWKEFVDIAKANPGKFNYGAAGGLGSLHNLLAEEMAAKAGLKLVLIPYRGGAQVDGGLKTGEIHVAFRTYGWIAANEGNPEFKFLAVTTAKRFHMAPNVPTFRELGVNTEFQTSIILIAAMDTPSDIVALLNREIVKASRLPDVEKLLHTLGGEGSDATPEQIAADMERELKYFGEAAKIAGLDPQ